MTKTFPFDGESDMAFYFQDDFYEAAKLMTEKDRRIFFDAIVTFFFDAKEIPDMPLTVRLAFIGFRERIAMARKQSENAKKPRKRNQTRTKDEPNDTQSVPNEQPNDSQTVATEYPNDSQTLPNDEPNGSQTLETPGESESESESEKKNTPKGVKKRVRFVPPTVEEVQAYCSESGHFVPAEQFVNFYESKGWMVGKNKMKSWKAAVRNWALRDKKEGGTPVGDFSKYAD